MSEQHAIMSLEELRKAFPNYKTHQDHQPVSERARVQANQARIEWMRQYKPVNSGDWLNFNRRGTTRHSDD